MFVLLLGCWTLSLISINVYFIVSSYCSPACGWCGIYMVLLNNRGTILLLSVFQYNHYKHTLPSHTSFNHLHILTSTVNTSLILESHCLFSHCAKILHNRKPGLMMHKHFRQNGSKVSLACTHIVVGLGWRNKRYSILFNYGGNTN